MERISIGNLRVHRYYQYNEVKVDIKNATTVLLLSSDNFLLNKLMKSLNSEGYHVESARDTKQALEKAKVSTINIVLLDEVIFDDHAADTGFILELKKTYPKVPMVMMVTPETEKKSLIHEMLGSGNIEHCIFKPFLPQSLISLVLNIITKSQMRLKRSEDRAMDSPDAKERRRFIRNNSPVDVSYFFIDKSQQTPAVVEHDAKSTNISAGGIQLDVGITENIPKYLDLKLVVPPGESVHTTGQVMWEKQNISANTKSVGIHFVDIKPNGSQLIDNYVMAK